MKRSLLNTTMVALVAGMLAGSPACLSAADKPSEPPASKPDGKSDQAGVSKFYGTISAVDTKAMTFTIDNVTYTVAAETHMTKADGDTPATLTDAVVGQPARGSYTKSADGKLNVTKVRFGKKTGGKTGGKSGGKSKEAKDGTDSKDAKEAPAPTAPAEK